MQSEYTFLVGILMFLLQKISRVLVVLAMSWIHIAIQWYKHCAMFQQGSEFNTTHSRMRSSLAKHVVQSLSSKRVRQIEICTPRH